MQEEYEPILQGCLDRQDKDVWIDIKHRFGVGTAVKMKVILHCIPRTLLNEIESESGNIHILRVHKCSQWLSMTDLFHLNVLVEKFFPVMICAHIWIKEGEEDWHWLGAS